MNTTTLSQAEIAITDRYWKMLNSLSNKVKLCLATRLTSSVIEETPETQHADAKDNFSIIDKFYGAWQGEESADEIISTIRNGHTAFIKRQDSQKLKQKKETPSLWGHLFLFPFPCLVTNK